MGESRRRKLAAGKAFEGLPEWHSTPAQIQDALKAGVPGWVAVTVGLEGQLDGAAADRAVNNLSVLLRRFPAHTQMALVVEGYEQEKRQPHLIPEVCSFMVSLLRKMDGRLPVSRLVPDTRLMLMRCNTSTWGVPVVALNSAGPIAWRLCDVAGASA